MFRVLGAAACVLCLSAPSLFAQEEIEKLIKQGKVHRMVIHNGETKIVQHFPLKKLSDAEMEMIRRHNRTATPDVGIVPAAFSEPARARSCDRVTNFGYGRFDGPIRTRDRSGHVDVSSRI